MACGKYRSSDPTVLLADRSSIYLLLAIIVSLANHITPMPRAPWTGEQYTPQIPAYYYTPKVINKKRSLEISPRDILKETLRG